MFTYYSVNEVCYFFWMELQELDLLQTQLHKISMKILKVRSFVWDGMDMKCTSGNYFS